MFRNIAISNRFALGMFCPPQWQCQGSCSLYEGIPSFGNVISKKCLVLKRFAIKCLFIMPCLFIQVLKVVNLSILGFHYQLIIWLNSWRSIFCLGDGLRNTQHQSILSWCFSYWLKLCQSCLVVWAESMLKVLANTKYSGWMWTESMSWAFYAEFSWSC